LSYDGKMSLRGSLPIGSRARLLPDISLSVPTYGKGGGARESESPRLLLFPVKNHASYNPSND